MQLFREHTPAWMHSLVIWNKVHPCYLHRLRNTKWPPGIVQIATVSTLTWHPCHEFTSLVVPTCKTRVSNSLHKLRHFIPKSSEWSWFSGNSTDLGLAEGEPPGPPFAIRDDQGSSRIIPMCVCACARAESAFFGLDPLDSNTLRIEAFDKLNPGHTSWS